MNGFFKTAYVWGVRNAIYNAIERKLVRIVANRISKEKLPWYFKSLSKIERKLRDKDNWGKVKKLS